MTKIPILGAAATDARLTLFLRNTKDRLHPTPEPSSPKTP
jgi:hypothetical protein